DADEAGFTALVRALGPAVGVRRRQEEHVHPLDERAVIGVDEAALHELLVEPVGEPARVEGVLEAPRALVVGGGHHPSFATPWSSEWAPASARHASGSCVGTRTASGSCAAYALSSRSDRKYAALSSTSSGARSSSRLRMV